MSLVNLQADVGDSLLPSRTDPHDLVMFKSFFPLANTVLLQMNVTARLLLLLLHSHS